VLRKAIVFCTSILFYVLSLHAQAGTRKALIIGNGQYKVGDQSAGFRNLPMTARDANAVGAMLEENGFEHADIKILTDQTLADMITALSDFSKSLRPNDSALFYFSGHGFALDGENYIVPIGFQFGESKASAVKAAVALKKVLNSIGRAQTRVVILDACRDEPPLPKGLDSNSSHAIGHLVPTQGSGSLVAFATSYGFTTSGSSVSGLSFYTQFLVESLKEHPPNMKDALDRAKDLLINADPDAPPPGIYNEMRGAFPLAGEPTRLPPAVAASSRSLDDVSNPDTESFEFEINTRADSANAALDRLEKTTWLDGDSNSNNGTSLRFAGNALSGVIFGIDHPRDGIPKFKDIPFLPLMLEFEQHVPAYPRARIDESIQAYRRIKAFCESQPRYEDADRKLSRVAVTESINRLRDDVGRLRIRNTQH
jgi:hypothetical protein